MSVYVDGMQAGYGRMIMCHMLADTDDELHAMADRIGVDRRWHQKAGTHHSHYDICKAKRALAVSAGAKEITRVELGSLLAARRRAGAQALHPIPHVKRNDDGPCRADPCLSQLGGNPQRS